LIENGGDGGGGKRQTGIADESGSNTKLVPKGKGVVLDEGYGRSKQKEKERKFETQRSWKRELGKRDR
jgi:hypothetical protein